MLRALTQGGGAGGLPALTGLSSTFLDGQGNFNIPPYPVGAGSGTVTSVDLVPPPVEFFASGGPVTAAGNLLFDWKAPTVVAHGGTGMGSFAANSLIRAGLSSTDKFQSTPLSNLSSNFLDGTGNWAIPPVPSGGAGTVTSVGLAVPVIEFFVTGSPVTGAGTFTFDWQAPVVVAHGGTGMGSFAASSLIQAGLSSTGKFQSIPLTLSSDFLAGNGAFRSGPAGRFLGTTVLTSGTSFTTGLQTNRIKVRLVAGGGAGGGVSTGVGQGGGAGGGSAGGYAEKTFAVLPNTAYTYAIGAGGTAGTAGNNPGNAGGITTFAVGALTVTANGGLGGPAMAAGAATLFALGAASPAVSVNGDVNSGGAPGASGIRVSQLICQSGMGGSGPFGAGGLMVIAQNSGQSGVGFGAGGSGGVCINNGGDVAGGAGLGGMIAVDEFT